MRISILLASVSQAVENRKSRATVPRRGVRWRPGLPIFRLYYRAGPQRIPQMSDFCELRGILLPRTPVNRGHRGRVEGGLGRATPSIESVLLLSP
jgi:hypothetical protein